MGEYPRTVIQDPSLIRSLRAKNHHPKTGIPEHLFHLSQNGVGLQSPADCYEHTSTLETDRTLDKILWGFLTTFYYDLISELDATKQRPPTTENGGVAFVVAVICQLGKHGPDTIQEKVIGWAKIGGRYRGFMDALCSGCLVLFPEKNWRPCGSSVVC